MSEKAKKKTIIVTPEFRVSYPSVFKSKMNTLNNKEEYSLVCLFSKGEKLLELKKIAMEEMTKKFGDNSKKWPKGWKSPFRDQGEREKEADDGTMYLPDGYEKGSLFISLRSAKKPLVVDRKRIEIGIDREEEFYAGCYARANVSCYAFAKGGGFGVGFGLTMLQKIRDGEVFSGRPKVEEAFEALEDDEGDASETDSVF